MVRKDSARIFTAIQETLAGTMVKYKRPTCTPSLSTIQKNLKQYHNIDVSLRSLKRYIRLMKLTGYLIVQRRWKRLEDGTIEGKSNRYRLGPSAIRFMCRMADKLCKIADLTGGPKMALNSSLRSYIKSILGNPYREKREKEASQWKIPPKWGKTPSRIDYLRAQAVFLRT